MYATMATSTSWFGARSVIAAAALLALITIAAVEAQDGCKTECYPDLKMINSKGGAVNKENCRWVMRTDGKGAHLCSHIKCRKVCPNNQARMAQDQQEAASSVASANLRIEQKLEGDQPLSSSSQGESMGIMRQMHGDKLSKAPVPGVAGGRLSSQSRPQQPSQPISPSGRRMAPTLAPVQFDGDDSPVITRFIDISPEE